ncbi:uncharacterized protein Dwil_GK11566 [Drosophila willistoni]|uniref:AMP-dependent synthetase/ligase domain-containing protein n=1 Tax=Drosophila willistoni TaxID=7260 RepID=B4N8Z3_DROWI|nr:4-coumarate--CoA ligase 1 [Drosophila willistoni]EDW80498.1 uncharacterized protein Dwil_GK11566 [Drosophila willistoni]
MLSIPTTYDDKTKVWSGMKLESVYKNDTSVGKIIFKTMRNWPRNVCQISDTENVTVTYGQALTWATRVALYLKKSGYNHTDVIGISAKNSTYVMPVAVACLMNATPFHSVNPLLDGGTIKHLFNITKPKVVFCDAADYDKVHSATSEFQPIIITLTGHLDGIQKIEDLFEPSHAEMFYEPEPLQDEFQTVAILCSSGTTGLPKAVCVPNGVLIQDSMAINSELIYFVSASLDWITGLWAFVFSAVFGATRIITTSPFDPANFSRMVEKYKINYCIIPPEHISSLVDCPEATSERLASLRRLNYGGGLVTVATLKNIQSLCPNAIISSAYGMTEVGSIALNLGQVKLSAAGKPLPGKRIRIINEQGKNLGYHEIGEICVHTGRVWSGYYNNPEESHRVQDDEGWFHTGDMGYFDEDNYLYIVDRQKEVRKYKGLQYWPTEIENVIAELPDVVRVCVVGIYDEHYGDEAGALVVKRKGSDLSANDIIEHVAKRLLDTQKQIRAGVFFTDKMPANLNGKVMRKAAHDAFIALSKK